MKIKHALALLLTAALATSTFAGDAKVTLDSADGSSAFLVRDSASNELARVQSDGKVGLGIAAPAYTLDVLGDINLTGLFYTNGVAWTPLTSFTETDPAFAASAAAGIDAEMATNWDAAFGWGDHALAGYLTAYTETDPVFAASVAGGIDAAAVANWNTAYGWGDHALVGYLTAYTETDPVFAASVAAGITADSTNAWNAKLEGSGTEGYLPKFTASGTVGNSALFSDASGNVGLGTNAPAYKLHVAGAIDATAITINGTPVASSTDTYWSTAGNGAIQYSGGNVGIGTATPAASAALEVTATDKGMLVPRLTQAQRDAVASPATGLLVYQTDNNPGFYFYDGAQWSSISAGAGAVTDVSATAPLASSGGTTPTLSLPAATSSANGYLTSTDWTTFNNKVATTRTISTTAPLTGGGDLSANRTLSIPAATASANGYLTSANWTTFNAKESALTFSAPLSRSVNAISIPAATASVNGYLSSTDWTTFNNKVSPGANSTITSLTGLTTDLSVAQGGTGASTLTGYVKGNGTSAMTASATIPGSAISGDISGTAAKATSLKGGNSTTLLGAIGYQSNTDTTTLLAPNTTTTKKFLRMTGTGSNGAAPVWDTAAAAGANSDITSLSGLTTDLSVAQGGTGASTASAARTNLGAAASGANSDITSLTGLTTDLSVAQGGTGASTLTANKVLVGNGASTPLQPTNLHWDNTNSRLGIGDTTPSYTVDVAGDVNVTGALRVNGTAINAGSMDYALAGKSSTQALSSSGGNDVVWAASKTTLRGEITLDVTGKYFTLKAGKTYELQAGLYLVFTSAGSGAYGWVDTSNAYIGNPYGRGEVLSTTYSTVHLAGQSVAITVFTPTVDTQVKLRVTSGTYLNYIAENTAYARIMQIP